MFNRHTSIPASTILFSIGLLLLAGPMVATILVFDGLNIFSCKIQHSGLKWVDMKKYFDPMVYLSTFAHLFHEGSYDR
jgi:hypothetical protein